ERRLREHASQNGDQRDDHDEARRSGDEKPLGPWAHPAPPAAGAGWDGRRRRVHVGLLDRLAICPTEQTFALTGHVTSERQDSPPLAASTGFARSRSAPDMRTLPFHRQLTVEAQV